MVNFDGFCTLWPVVVGQVSQKCFHNDITEQSAEVNEAEL